MFVIHLPPGIRQRKRWFGVDFRAPWTYLFVDDIRAERLGEDVGMLHLMQHSPYELVCDGVVNVRQIVSAKYQSALCACGVPYIDDPELADAASAPARVRMLFVLLQNADFLKYMDDAIVGILRERQSVDKSGMHVHVSIIREGGLTGNLGQFSWTYAINSCFGY